jgi:hypothetical protein
MPSISGRRIDATGACGEIRPTVATRPTIATRATRATRQRPAVLAVLAATVSTALTGCGVLPGFYSEAGERDALVEECVDYVTMGAFAGDPDARRTWDGVDQDAARLRSHCEGLVDTDPSKLDEYSRLKRSLERSLAAEQRTEPSQLITDTSSGPQCNANYSGLCLPIDDDVDCLPGDGDGPWFIDKTVVVMGEDVFALDDDDDGLGCEPNPGQP